MTGAFEAALAPKATKSVAGFHLDPVPAHTLTLNLSQENKNFRLCRCTEVSLGNVREAGSGAAVKGSEWVGLQVTKQFRNKDAAWVVECSLPKLPKCLTEAGAEGKVFELTCKFALPEFERLGDMEEPLTAEHPITIRVCKGAASADVNESEKAKRLSQTVSSQEVFLGMFEVSDSAVNDVMKQMRASASVDGDAAKEVLLVLDKQVNELKLRTMQEMSRQFESLAAKATPAGMDIEANLKLWQLPAELLGLSDELSNDPAVLKKRIAELEALLKERDAEIAKLKGGRPPSAAGSAAAAAKALKNK